LPIRRNALMGTANRKHCASVCIFVVLSIVFVAQAAAQEFDPKQRNADVSKRHAAVQMSAAEAASSKGPESQLWEIHIHHFQYNDGKPAKITSGDWVVWINDDNMQHSATSSSGAVQFDTGLLQPGQRSKAIQFLAETPSAGINYSCLVHDQMQGTLIVSGPVPPASPPPGPPTEAPSTHSFVVVGRESMFLHHIALYHDSNHQYEVTLEATLDDPVAQKAYQDYRAKYGDELTVLDPEYFILGELDNGSRRSFKATFFRQEWMTPPIDGLQNVVVRVKRKIAFRHFAQNDIYPSRLEYQLVGSAHEAFLIHRITKAPNFQQVIKLDKVPDFLSLSAIADSPDLIVVDKQLAADDTYSLKAAVLSNGTHILLGPPPGTLNPNQPTTDGEELTVQITGDTGTHKVKVNKNIYFDVRILNK
jgi:plastocyanin